MTEGLIFISYSHKDMTPVNWLEKLELYLASLSQDSPVHGWADNSIPPGSQWPREIESALSKAVRKLEEIESAEFFFGPAWGDRVFPVANEGGMIGIRTSAWGPFLATCQLTFKDKSHSPVILHRYVDFEMAGA